MESQGWAAQEVSVEGMEQVYGENKEKQNEKPMAMEGECMSGQAL